MAWITITEDKVLTKLSGPEKAAMNSAALQAAQIAPLPEIIDEITKEIRGYVAACPGNILGPLGTVPDELLGAAISRIRFEFATRLPVTSLLTEDRRTANSNAISLFQRVADCKFAIIDPVTPADEQAGGPSIELVSASPRKASRTKLSGL